MQTKTIATPCGNVIGEITPYGLRFRGIKYATAGRFEMPAEVRSFGGDLTRQNKAYAVRKCARSGTKNTDFIIRSSGKEKSLLTAKIALSLTFMRPTTPKLSRDRVYSRRKFHGRQHK